MGIEVNIDADAINAAVTQAVVESVVGEQLKKAIEEALKPSGYGRQSAVQAVVTEEVRKAIQNVIAQESLDNIISASTQALLKALDEVRRY
jgi:O-acetyl-ADP-ribose deacetylase (regulator of RNase III)